MSALGPRRISVPEAEARVLSTFLMDRGSAVNTATARAAEAIEAAEIMFLDEIGAT